MAIESVDDAKEYFEKVERALMYLSGLAKEAGIFSHAGLFLGVSAAFAGGPDEIDKIAGLVHRYVCESLGIK